MEIVGIRDIKKLKKIKTIETYDGGSKIYVLDNHEKYKELASEFRLLKKVENKEFYENLKKQIELGFIDGFTFPKKIVASTTRLYGYISDFADGECLDSFSENIDIKSLITITNYLSSQVRKLSECDCLIEDLHSGNIIVNGDKAKIIDTDFYSFNHLKNREELKKWNLSILSKTIISILGQDIKRSNILKDPELYFAYIMTINGKYSCAQFIDLLIYKIKINQLIQVNDVKTLKKVL